MTTIKASSLIPGSSFEYAGTIHIVKKVTEYEVKFFSMRTGRNDSLSIGNFDLNYYGFIQNIKK